MSKNDSGMTRRNVEFRFEQIPLGKLRIEPSIYSFREAHNLTDTALQPFADDILANGLKHALTAIDQGEFKLVTDGNRRTLAMLQLVRRNVKGWTLDRLIPVNLMPSDTPMLEALIHSISPNLQQKSYDALGRALAAASLYKQGATTAEIAGIFSVNEKTISRDVSVASVPRAMGLVRDSHAIQFTTLTVLIPKAQKVNRLDELFDAIDDHAAWARREFRKENARRRSGGHKELTGEKIWPVKKLTKARLAAWEIAMEKNLPFDQPESIQFAAAVQTEGGVKRIKVSALNVIVEDASLDDIRTIYERTTRFQLHLQNALREKGNLERTRTPDSVEDEKVFDKLKEDYQNLGIADLVQPDLPETDGEDAEGFDEPEERQETDALGDTDAADGDDAETTGNAAI